MGLFIMGFVFGGIAVMAMYIGIWLKANGVHIAQESESTQASDND